MWSRLRSRPSSSIRALVFLVLGDVTPSWSSFTRGSAGRDLRLTPEPPSPCLGLGLEMGLGPGPQAELSMGLWELECSDVGLGLDLGIRVDVEELGLCAAVL